MPEYLIPPIETDPDALAGDAFAYLEASVPGWEAAPPNLDVLIIEAISQEAAEQADVASRLTTAIFRYFGALVNVPPLDAVAAQASVEFTVRDAAGYTIPAGTVVGVRDVDGTLQGFDTLADVVIAPGGTTGTGAAFAETAGIIANELTGDAELVDAPASVVGATFLAPSAGGSDAEDDDVYLERLTDTLALLSPRPILPGDFAVLARSVAGVYRAAAVDLLKPGPPYSGTAEDPAVALTVTVALADTLGEPVSPTVRAAVQAFLTAEREQGFAVFAVDPQYETIDVNVSVQAWPGWDAADVKARVEAALAAFLSPASWGGSTSDDGSTWLNAPVVRQSELFTVVKNVEGVRWSSALTFRKGSAGAYGTADVTMGAASAIPALPRPGVMVATVTPG